MKRSISKAGVETMASTSPLRGSITTTAPGLPSMAPLGHFLHAPIDGGDDLGAGMRLGGLDQPHLPAHRVDLEALAAVLAAQELVEQALEPALPDHVAAPIAALLQLLVAGLAHVAQQMGGEAAVRIDALRLDLHDHARQLELPLLDLGDVVERGRAARARAGCESDETLATASCRFGKGDLEQAARRPSVASPWRRRARARAESARA